MKLKRMHCDRKLFFSEEIWLWKYFFLWLLEELNIAFYSNIKLDRQIKKCFSIHWDSNFSGLLLNVSFFYHLILWNSLEKFLNPKFSTVYYQVFLALFTIICVRENFNFLWGAIKRREKVEIKLITQHFYCNEISRLMAPQWKNCK